MGIVLMSDKILLHKMNLYEVGMALRIVIASTIQTVAESVIMETIVCVPVVLAISFSVKIITEYVNNSVAEIKAAMENAMKQIDQTKQATENISSILDELAKDKSLNS